MFYSIVNYPPPFQWFLKAGYLKIVAIFEVIEVICNTDEIQTLTIIFARDTAFM